MTAQLQGIGMTSRRTRMRLVQRLREAGHADQEPVPAGDDRHHRHGDNLRRGRIR